VNLIEHSYCSYRVRGTLLATRDSRCYSHLLDLTDVDHDAIEVDLIVWATSTPHAVADVAWIAAQDYTTWRWQKAPQVAVVEAIEEVAR